VLFSIFPPFFWSVTQIVFDFSPSPRQPPLSERSLLSLQGDHPSDALFFPLFLAGDGSFLFRADLDRSFSLFGRISLVFSFSFLPLPAMLTVARSVLFFDEAKKKEGSLFFSRLSTIRAGFFPSFPQGCVCGAVSGNVEGRLFFRSFAPGLTLFSPLSLSTGVEETEGCPHRNRRESFLSPPPFLVGRWIP